MLQPQITDALDRVRKGDVGDSVESRELDYKTVGRTFQDALTNLAEAAVCVADAQGVRTGSHHGQRPDGILAQP